MNARPSIASVRPDVSTRVLSRRTVTDTCSAPEASRANPARAAEATSNAASAAGIPLLTGGDASPGWHVQQRRNSYISIVTVSVSEYTPAVAFCRAWMRPKTETVPEPPPSGTETTHVSVPSAPSPHGRVRAASR